MVIVFITGFSFSGFSQGEFNNWYFGDNAGITFNSGSPVALFNCSSLFFSEFCPSTVSDSSGNLLFYIDDETIYNRNHVAMPNGGGLASDYTVYQPSIVARSLTDDSVYYVFVMDEYAYSWNPNRNGLSYSIIDMSLNGGLGDIVPGYKNIQVPGASFTSKVLTGTRHQNLNDAWIVVRNYMNSHNYLTYLFNSSGITNTPVISTSLVKLRKVGDDYTPQPSRLRISPDATKLICIYDSIAEFCQFNDATGLITPLFCFKDSLPYLSFHNEASVEFSLDSRYVYISNTNGNSESFAPIWQFDASNTDSLQFLQSRTLIADNQYPTGLQRGPDGKIYCTRAYWYKDSIGVISYPENQGIGCGFTTNALFLGNDSYFGFPQPLQRYYLYINQSGQCQGRPIGFSFITWPPPDSIIWDFGDPASGAGNYSTEPDPVHTYSTSGTFIVTLIIRHNDHRFDTTTHIIVIKETPAPILGPDRQICFGDTVTLDAGFCTGCTYQWDNIATGQINIGNGQTLTVYDSGLYVVHVTNNSGCTGRDTVQVSVSPPPLLTTSPLSKSICSGDSTYIVLSSNVSGATFHWTASLTSGNISGFSADSGSIINQILINTTSSPGIVTYHITPKVGNCIGDTSDYAVTVDPRDTASVSITASATVICAGTSVTFSTTAVNGGSNPSYHWLVNGINVGTNNPVFTYIPASLDLVSCILTSSLPDCLTNNPDTSNVIPMTVNPYLPVSVSVIPSANPFCLGTPVTFSTTAVNGGSNPSYQWLVNGINVGTNNPIFTYIPASLDLVSCILTSSLPDCLTNNPDTSAQITMIGFPGLPADVTISAAPSPSCQGVPVTFTATPINGGSSPSYQWQVNGINVGTNSPVYSYIPSPNDSIRCIMTSNLPCVSNNPVFSPQSPVFISPTPIVTLTPCFDTITTVNAKPIKLKGGIPLGGTYTGPGVSGGFFYPNLAGSGNHQITYTYTNSGNCTDAGSLMLDVIVLAPFACGNNLIDIRDGKVYPTIQVGSQCWFAADLNFGTEIPPTLHQRDNCIIEKYFNPASSIQHPASVYQWDELMRYDPTPASQGLCPPNWHIPTEAEWATLFANWTNNAFAASPLKYSGYSGFNAFLSGARHETVQWDYQTFAVFFWSSTAYGPFKAWAHGMNDPDPSVSYYPSLRSNAFLVRCLRD